MPLAQRCQVAVAWMTLCALLSFANLLVFATAQSTGAVSLHTDWVTCSGLPSDGNVALKTKGGAVWALNGNRTNTVWQIIRSSSGSQQACNAVSKPLQPEMQLRDLAIDSNNDPWVLTQDDKFYINSNGWGEITRIPGFNDSAHNQNPYFNQTLKSFDVYNGTVFGISVNERNEQWPWVCDKTVQQWHTMFVNRSGADIVPTFTVDGKLATLTSNSPSAPFVLSELSDVRRDVVPTFGYICASVSFANGTGCCVTPDGSLWYYRPTTLWKDITSALGGSKVIDAAVTNSFLFVSGSDNITRVTNISDTITASTPWLQSPPLRIINITAADTTPGNASVWGVATNHSLFTLNMHPPAGPMTWTPQEGPGKGVEIQSISTNKLGLPWAASKSDVYYLNSDRTWSKLGLPDTGTTFKSLSGTEGVVIAVGTDDVLYEHVAGSDGGSWLSSGYTAFDSSYSIALDATLLDIYVGMQQYLAKITTMQYFAATDLQCGVAAMMFKPSPPSGICVDINGFIKVFHNNTVQILDLATNQRCGSQPIESIVMTQQQDIFIACGPQVFALSLQGTGYAGLFDILGNNSASLPNHPDATVAPSPSPTGGGTGTGGQGGGGKSGTNLALILGIVIGIAAALAVFAAIMAYVMRQNYRRAREKSVIEKWQAAHPGMHLSQLPTTTPSGSEYRRSYNGKRHAMVASTHDSTPHIFTYRPPATIDPRFLESGAMSGSDATSWQMPSTSEAPSMSNSVLRSLLDITKAMQSNRESQLPPLPVLDEDKEIQLVVTDPAVEVQPPVAAEGLLALLRQCKEDFITKSIRPMKGVDLNIDPDRDVKVGQLLGHGAHGLVYEGWWTRQDGSKKHVAVKVLRPESTDAAMRALFQEEMEIMTRINHANVVRCYGGCNRDDCCMLLLELVEGGTLDNYIHDVRKTLTEGEVLVIAHQIASALAHLHPTVVHADIKPQNILLDARGQVKLADFGMSKLKLGRQMETQLGCTPPYTAPEVLDGSKCTEKVDVYSLAVVMWECLTGEYPFKNATLYDIITKVKIEGARPTIPPHVSKEVRDIIEECWHAEPRMRPSAHEVSRTTLLLAKQLHGTFQQPMEEV